MQKEGKQSQGKKKKKLHPDAKLTFLKEHKREKASRLKQQGSSFMKLWNLDLIE